ncbi:uncharacterized protein LOC143276579 isoform X2 [Babylonia areolata]|uniref:uncharacterized protein LOC143276579 isoform X2 n=1 Tax=Babylonia areolata TaxID=304850 RepID=UPI003FD4221F
MMQDHRFKGFPSHSMQSPRQPVTAPMSEDKRRNEENFVKVFGKSSIFDPAKPRIDEGHRGLQYGTDQIDNSPRARGLHDPFNEKSSAEVRKISNMKSEAQDDILRFKQEKMMQDFQREEERKKDIELQSKYYPWDRLNEGHGAPKGDNRRRKFLETDVSPRDTVTYSRDPQKPQKGHDLFLDTLGGPGGTVVRQDGGPSLQSMPDPRMGAFRSPGPGGYERQADISQQEDRIREQKHKIDELKKELEFLKSPRGQETLKAQGGGLGGRLEPSNNRYEPSFGRKDSPPPRHSNAFDLDQPRREERRSLDLEATRGGAGAPLRDDRGKPITRYPVTMERDDYGTVKIQERIPGKRYALPQESIYDPFGKPGGGAPMVDRYGNRNTHTYGNFEKQGDSAEATKRARAKEVMLHELRAGMQEQKRNKEEMNRYLKAPQGELAELIRSKEVGQPKRDPITGTLANQHLPNSDVSKIKMNYQPVEDTEKRRLHEYLKEQMEEGERSKHLEKLRDRQESNKHFSEFDQQWGAFGGGAPKDRVIRKKVNLDNALYHYDRQVNNPSYQKRYLEEDVRHHHSSDVTPRYVKNTVQSKSSNLYEYPSDKSPRSAQRGYAPWATESAHVR